MIDINITIKALFLLYKGNKKGPVKRWDFDTEDDYSAYQSKREALPKYKTCASLLL